MLHHSMLSSAARLAHPFLVVFFFLYSCAVHPWMSLVLETLAELTVACLLWWSVHTVGYVWTTVNALLLSVSFRVAEVVADRILELRALRRRLRVQILLTVAKDTLERLQWQRWLLLAHGVRRSAGAGRRASAPPPGAFLFFGLLRLGLKHAPWRAMLGAGPADPADPPALQDDSVPHWPHQRRADVLLLAEMADRLILRGTPHLVGCLRCASFIFRASRCVVMEGGAPTVPSAAFDELVRRTLALASRHFPDTKAAVFVCEVAKHARINVSCGRRALTKRVCL
jgi:hypothetical protein